MPRTRPATKTDRVPPSVYVGVIRRLVPAEDPAHVEAWLRREHGPLDAIAAIDFARATKLAAQRARATGREANDDLARSYGLATGR
jgi:hypothetical protein